MLKETELRIDNNNYFSLTGWFVKYTVRDFIFFYLVSDILFYFGILRKISTYTAYNNSSIQFSSYVPRIYLQIYESELYLKKTFHVSRLPSRYTDDCYVYGVLKWPNFSLLHYNIIKTLNLHFIIYINTRKYGWRTWVMYVYSI